MRSRLRSKAIPERIRLSFVDDPTGSTPLSLPSRRTWPISLLLGVVFAIFAGIAVAQIGSMRGQSLDTVFELMIVLFQGFWVLGWSVGVMILFLLTVLFLLYGESARITGHRLVHVVRLGPVKLLLEYDLTKVHNPRLEGASGSDRFRIRFDYGGGGQTLGNDMPRAVAEGVIQAIQSAITRLAGNDYASASEHARTAEESGIDLTKWISRRMAPRPKDVVPTPRRDLRTSASERPRWTSGSGLALMVANLIPLGGVLVLNWDLGEVITLFWAENAVVGFYTILKLAVVARWGALFFGPFFLGHYGGFMAAHFLFIYELFVRGIEQSGPEVQAFTAFGGPVPAAMARLFGVGGQSWDFLLRQFLEAQRVRWAYGC